MDYSIVIPSYKRPEICRDKTLAVLHAYNIPKDRIFVIVADKDQEVEYKNILDPKTYGKILVGVPGLAKVRNWIFLNFPKGSNIVSCDDDINGFIEYTTSTKRHEQRLRSLKDVIRRGFSECKKANCSCWGIYPSPNGFFMKPTVSTDLKFIIGSFCGFVNPGKEVMIEISGGEKDDYERTIKFFQRDGAVVRLNFVSAKTSTYKTPGGLQLGNRLKRERATVKGLMKKYPGWIRVNPTRKSKMPEIRLINPEKNVTRKKR
jgi:hypothetical protein